MESLKDHFPVAEQNYQEAHDMLNAPASSQTAEELTEFVQTVKANSVDIETDLRDAKRRVTAAKGGNKSKKTKKADDEAECNASDATDE